MTRCADLCHVPLEGLDHDFDRNGTPVASAAVAQATDLGWVVTSELRRQSPNGLAWPGVVPPWRPTAKPQPCHACAASKCRRLP